MISVIRKLPCGSGKAEVGDEAEAPGMWHLLRFTGRYDHCYSTALMRYGLWLTDPAETGSLGLEAASSDMRLNIKPAGQGS
jgi:hypothetical protein